mgnify:CR=1 FL=1
MFYKVAHFLVKWLIRILFCYRVIGRENIPQGTGFIVCSNHKSAWDVIVSGSSYPNGVVFMAKKELFENKFAAFWLKKLKAFPVSRGTADISAIKNSIKALKDGQVLNIYPEGTRVRDGEKHEFKGGAALIALKAKVPIVPCAICGEYKLFGQIRFVVGKPIYLDEYYGTKLSEEETNEIMERVMKEVYALREANEKR